MSQFSIDSDSQYPVYIPEEAVCHVRSLLHHGEDKICSTLEFNGGTANIPYYFSNDDNNHICKLRCYRVECVRYLFRLADLSARSQTLNQPDSLVPSSILSSQAGAGTGNREKIFGCTVCDQHLSDAQSWKNHEKIQHEKDEAWICDVCQMELPRQRKFRQHHIFYHSCRDCDTHDKECAQRRLKESPRCSGCECAKKAHTVRFVPTAYACGFCGRLLIMSWDERCKHIITHFNKGERIANWDHSKVIRALISGRVDLRNAFVNFISRVDSQLQTQFSWDQFSWDKENTDELLFDLKCWKPEETPFQLIQSAYSLSTRTSPLRQSHPSSQEHTLQTVGASTTQLGFNSSRHLDLLEIGMGGIGSRDVQPTTSPECWQPEEDPSHLIQSADSLSMRTNSFRRSDSSSQEYTVQAVDPSVIQLGFNFPRNLDPLHVEIGRIDSQDIDMSTAMYSQPITRPDLQILFGDLDRINSTRDLTVDVASPNASVPGVFNYTRQSGTSPGQQAGACLD